MTAPPAEFAVAEDDGRGRLCIAYSPANRSGVHISCIGTVLRFQLTANAITAEQPFGNGASIQVAPSSSVPNTSPFRVAANTTARSLGEGTTAIIVLCA